MYTKPLCYRDLEREHQAQTRNDGCRTCDNKNTLTDTQYAQTRFDTIKSLEQQPHNRSVARDFINPTHIICIRPALMPHVTPLKCVHVMPNIQPHPHPCTIQCHNIRCDVTSFSPISKTIPAVIKISKIITVFSMSYSQ